MKGEGLQVLNEIMKTIDTDLQWDLQVLRSHGS